MTAKGKDTVEDFGGGGITIEQVREEIDSIDRRILDLLNQRARLAVAAAPLKAARDSGVFSPQREAQIVRELCAANPGPLPNESLEPIIREIISACRALQAPVRVAFLGPEGTFSHLAALEHFGTACDFAPQGTISQVIAAVERGKAPVGLVPVENSSEGGVNETLDRLVASGLRVCGETFLRVSHMLMASGGSLQDIDKVYSHPQPLSQCRNWLNSNLPGVSLVAVSSTAVAAKKAAVEPGTAAVGSELAAEQEGLTILSAEINDIGRNLTRFFLVGQNDCPPTGRDKTSLVFIANHRPGALHSALGHLARRGINLSRIESRPTKDRPWEYAFFVDLDGHREDAMVAEALADLSDDVAHLKVLGSYPQGTTPGAGRERNGAGS